MWTRLHVEMTPAAGRPIRRAGYTLSVLRKTNGRWQMVRGADMLTPASD
jgi:hypothetical protein